MLPLQSQARRPLVLREGTPLYELGRHLEYLADAQGRWTIEVVSSDLLNGRFEQNRSEVPNFGYTSIPHWFRLEIQSNLGAKQRFILEVGFPVLDRIDAFIETADGGFSETTVGESFPHGNKVFEHRNFCFPIEIDPGQRKKIYLRVETQGVLQVPLRLWTPQAFLKNERALQLFYGIFFGFLFVTFFYNLFIFLVIRDRSYLYLVCFIFSGFLVTSAHVGLAQEWLWPSFPWLANRALLLGIWSTALFVSLFIREFLNMSRDLPLWGRIFKTLAMAFVAGLALSTFAPYNIMVIIVSIIGAIALPLTLIVPILSWRRGFKPARYYLVAWGTLLLMALVTALNKLGLVPRTTLTENVYMIGGAMVVVLLSFALADRINILQREKDLAQAEALDLQRRAADHLEQQVQIRTHELEQAYERLAEHDRLKSRFFSNVSHEVRTPLTLILTPLERLLAEERLSDTVAVKKLLRSMAGNAQRLLRLVNQLLDFSRLESGGTMVSFERLDLLDLVEPIARAFEPFARSKGLKLALSAPDDLPAIYTDPGKLDKVVSNLLSNACKFTDPDGTVIVRLARADDTVILSVADTGMGIAEKDLSKIFERFRQVDGSASRRHGGTGIGLALSKELVEIIGGRLEVTSEIGSGSTFTVTLPLGQDHIKDPALIRASEDSRAHEAVAAKEASAALAAEVGVSDEEQTRDIRVPAASPDPADKEDTRPLVLVVEDNPDMRALVAEICQQEFRVLEAADGEQGLAVLKEHRPALVISDIMMPGIDGQELLRRLRSDPATSTIPVILLTAKAGPEMRLEGLEGGADDYLAKPFESRELMARARNLVRLQLQEQRLRELNTRLQQDVVKQATELERARMLGRYLSPGVVRSILEGDQPVQVGQQRRRITVFQLELRGFDMVAEVVEPKTMAAMLNGYLSAMMEVAFARGATVDTVVQETVRGFFGAPASFGPEQDAVRCARMALEMWQRAVEVCQQWQEHLMGRPPAPTLIMASGYATVGNFGSSSRLEYTAVGGPVNEVNSLMPYIQPGMVACSQTTWSLIDREVEGRFCEPVRLPHRSHPTSVYRLAALESPDIASVPTPSLIGGGAAQVGQPDVITGPIIEATAERGVDALDKGMVIARRYQVVSRLGTGGMGAVYQMRDLKVGADVAMKIIWQHLREDRGALKRFYREVRLARLVSHFNVARIFDLGEWEGHEFITMEYIHGQSLAHRLSREGPFPLAEGQTVLQQICEGLTAAHLAGIVHQDLKPANIMLEQGGRVVILDFGIARLVEAQHADTEGHESTGTPSYMAPEQFARGEIDHRADIYSLGVVAYEMFTGQRPFVADNLLALAARHVYDPPPDPQTVRPDLPPRLTAVILRCLEKAPGDRFAAVSEISPLIGGEPSVA